MEVTVIDNSTKPPKKSKIQLDPMDNKTKTSVARNAILKQLDNYKGEDHVDVIMNFKTKDQPEEQDLNDNFREFLTALKNKSLSYISLSKIKGGQKSEADDYEDDDGPIEVDLEDKINKNQ